jgi:hypothetical protein
MMLLVGHKEEGEGEVLRLCFRSRESIGGVARVLAIVRVGSGSSGACCPVSDIDPEDSGAHQR